MGPVSPNVKYIYYFLQNIAPFNFFFFLKKKKFWKAKFVGKTGDSCNKISFYIFSDDSFYYNLFIIKGVKACYVSYLHNFFMKIGYKLNELQIL